MNQSKPRENRENDGFSSSDGHFGKQVESWHVKVLRNQIRREKEDRKSGQNPNSRQTPVTIFQKIRSITRQGQYTNSAVRRRVVPSPPKKKTSSPVKRDGLDGLNAPVVEHGLHLIPGLFMVKNKQRNARNATQACSLISW